MLSQIQLVEDGRINPQTIVGPSVEWSLWTKTDQHLQSNHGEAVKSLDPGTVAAFLDTFILDDGVTSIVDKLVRGTDGAVVIGMSTSDSRGWAHGEHVP